MRRTVIVLAALWAGVSMADYVNMKNNYGMLRYETCWEGDVVPCGSSTGLVTSAADAGTDGRVVTGSYWYDVAVRQIGGYVVSGSAVGTPGGDLALRGGSDGSGVTTLYEIEDTNTVYSSYTNLYVSGKILFWSQYANPIEVSLLSGHIETAELSLNTKESTTSNHGTINLRDGIFHAGSLTKGAGNINFLADGSGEMIIDTLACDLSSSSYVYFGLNFETGTRCKLTFGARDGYADAQGVFEQLIDEGRVSIDGTVTTDPELFTIVNDGTSSSIELAPYVHLKNPYGVLSYFAYWENDEVPFGTSTGLVTSGATGSLVTGAAWYDVAVRQVGGYVSSGTVVGSPGGDFVMRGGSDGSGVTTIYEIEDLDIDCSTQTNLYIDGQFLLWSQYGNPVELSLLSGHIEAGELKLSTKTGATSNNGTVNLRDGLLHAGTLTKGAANINFLSGGSGEMVIDTLACDLSASAWTYFGLNFETGTDCRVTFGARDGYDNAQGVFEQLIEEGRVMIDGTVTTNETLFAVINSGTASTLALASSIEGYADWAAVYGLTETNGTGAATADADGDGLSNLAEYAIGGDPVDFSNRGYDAVLGMSQDSGTNWYLYVHYERANKDDLGLSYTPEHIADLLSTNWTSAGFETVGSGSYDSDFNVVTNRIPVDDADCGFARVKIEMQ